MINCFKNYSSLVDERLFVSLIPVDLILY